MLADAGAHGPAVVVVPIEMRRLVCGTSAHPWDPTSFTPWDPTNRMGAHQLVGPRHLVPHHPCAASFPAYPRPPRPPRMSAALYDPLSGANSANPKNPMAVASAADSAGAREWGRFAALLSAFSALLVALFATVTDYPAEFLIADDVQYVSAFAGRRSSLAFASASSS